MLNQNDPPAGVAHGGMDSIRGGQDVAGMGIAHRLSFVDKEALEVDRKHRGLQRRKRLRRVHEAPTLDRELGQRDLMHRVLVLSARSHFVRGSIIREPWGLDNDSDP